MFMWVNFDNFIHLYLGFQGGQKRQIIFEVIIGFIDHDAVSNKKTELEVNR